MHPTPLKVVEDGLTAYTLSGNSPRKLVFFRNLSNIFTTNHNIGLPNIYSHPC